MPGAGVYTGALSIECAIHDFSIRSLDWSLSNPSHQFTRQKYQKADVCHVAIPKNKADAENLGMDSDSHADDSSPENVRIQLELFELGRLLHSGATVDWQESRRWCSEVLSPLTESDGNKRLVAMLDGARYIVGGDEHHLILPEEDPGRVYKFTHGDNFGCRSYFSKHDPELTGRHFHGTGNADPFYYLHRWVILNSIGGFQTRFEGIVPPEKSGHLPRFCISQPVLKSQAPDRRNPTEREIEISLERFGFRKISADVFLKADSRILLTDAAPRNVRVFDGIPVSFDAVAELASDEIMGWACGIC